jgi:hypothetical protein
MPSHPFTAKCIIRLTGCDIIIIHLRKKMFCFQLLVLKQTSFLSRESPCPAVCFLASVAVFYLSVRYAELRCRITAYVKLGRTDDTV